MRPVAVPLRRSEVLERWADLASELGLDPLPDDLDLGDHDDSWWTLYGVAEVDEALDAAVHEARKRRPVYRLARVDGQPALTADPRGLADNLDAALADLRYAVLEERRRLIADEISAERATRVAARWGVARSTIYRWSVPNSAPNGTAEADSEAEHSDNAA